MYAIKRANGDWLVQWVPATDSFDIIRAVRRALQPFTVVVIWEGDAYEHGAWTTSDAREWFACYPNEATCAMFVRGFRKIVAMRGACA